MNSTTNKVEEDIKVLTCITRQYPIMDKIQQIAQDQNNVSVKIICIDLLTSRAAKKINPRQKKIKELSCT